VRQVRSNSSSTQNKNKGASVGNPSGGSSIAQLSARQTVQSANMMTCCRRSRSLQKPAYSQKGVHENALRISSVLQPSAVFRERLPWLRLQGVSAPSLASGGLPHQFPAKDYTRDNCRALTEVNICFSWRPLLLPMSPVGPKAKTFGRQLRSAAKGGRMHRGRQPRRHHSIRTPIHRRSPATPLPMTNLGSVADRDLECSDRTHCDLE
jgi:hypothetical protein